MNLSQQFNQKLGRYKIGDNFIFHNDEDRCGIIVDKFEDRILVLYKNVNAITKDWTFASAVISPNDDWIVMSKIEPTIKQQKDINKLVEKGMKKKYITNLFYLEYKYEQSKSTI